MKINRKTLLASTCIVCMGSLLSSQAMAAEALFSGASISFSAADCSAAQLSVGGDGFSTSRNFDSCSSMIFEAVDDAGQPLADGTYSYQLTVEPQAMADDKEALETAKKENNADAVNELQNLLQNGDYATEGVAGMFRVSQGFTSEITATSEDEVAEAEAEEIAAAAGSQLESGQ